MNNIPIFILACLSEEFNCADGTCISQVLVCNGVKDCDNGNDEIICKGKIDENLIELFT